MSIRATRNRREVVGNRQTLKVNRNTGFGRRLAFGAAHVKVMSPTFSQWPFRMFRGTGRAVTLQSKSAKADVVMPSINTTKSGAKSFVFNFIRNSPSNYVDSRKN
jgi:hypothetical protein